MSDRNREHANGRGDPADLPAGELATWWDWRTAERRSGAANRKGMEPAVAAIAQLEALARVDDLSAPRPGFLDQLEKQIMQTPVATLPPPVFIPQPEPSWPAPIRRPARRGRGLVDILTVAAVLALLLGGSWSVLNDRANAPTSGGLNGVAGLSTPDDSRAATDTPTDTPSDSVALDQPWAVNQDDDRISGVFPVETSGCRTSPRPAGSVAGLISAATGSSTATTTLATDLFPSLPYTGATEDLVGLVQEYPTAPQERRSVVEAVYAQSVACRFDNGKQTGGSAEPYTGAYWNLFATAYFQDRLGLSLGNPVNDVDEAIRQRFGDEPAVGGQGAYPPRVLDVRTLPATAEGEPRLLVLQQSVTGFERTALDVLVYQDDMWRFAGQQVVTSVSDSSSVVFPVDVGIGTGASGTTSIQVVGAQFEAGAPVTLTFANRGRDARDVIIDGQRLGTISPGDSLRVRPFVVPGEAVAAAGSRLDIRVTALPVGVETSDSAGVSTNLQVFPAGGLARRFGLTPSTPASGTGATPDVAITGDAVSPVSTPMPRTPVLVAPVARPDRVVE